MKNVPVEAGKNIKSAVGDRKFKFCPACAARLIYKKEGKFNRPTCSGCGFVFYQNSKPTAGAIIIQNKRILLTRRAIEPYFGWWHIPGGFLEKGEEPKSGLKREIKEELNLRIQPQKIIAIIMDKYISDYEDQATMNIFYDCQFLGGAMKLDHEISEAKWFSKKNLPPKIAFGCCQRVMEIIKKSWL